MQVYLNRRSGLTRLELIVLLAAGFITIALLKPTICVVCELPNRAVCSANIRGIIQSMYIYAQSNNGRFPCTPGPNGVAYSNAPQYPSDLLPSRTAKKITAAWFGSGKVPRGSDLGNPLACMWLLVLGGEDVPKSFICPGDPTAVQPSLEYTMTPNAGRTAAYQANFGVRADGHSPGLTGRGESYSIAYPWLPAVDGSVAQPGPWWTDHDNSNEPVASDMAPADLPASGIANRIMTVLPKANTYGNFIYNSGNHSGDGENVGFGDDHVSWEVNPYCGVHRDNIFTYYSRDFTGSGDAPSAPQVGLSGLGTRVPAPVVHFSKHSFYDLCMVPVREVNSGAW